MRVAIYARVSTDDKGQDPLTQLLPLREFVARRGWELAGEYVDRGVSGTTESRPALNKMMHSAKQRKVDAIVCWKLDRFGRSLRHIVNALADLEAVGVAFVSLSDNIDLSTPSGRLMAQIIAAMAEFEHALISERTKAGIARRMKQDGATWGRKRLRLNTARAQQMLKEGLSYADIGKKLRCSRAVVWRRLNLAAQKGW